MNKALDRISFVLICLSVFMLAKGGCGLPLVGPAATAATYVYEKDETAVPNGVKVGIDRLNREKNIVATVYDDDTRDGSGEVPDQYKVPLKAATDAGLPALVVTSGDTVLNVVKAPTTADEVVGAVR